MSKVLSNPFPNPNSTTNIKIPKATVKPERKVLNLFFLIVTHEEDIAKMCSRIVRLKDGIIMEDKKNKMIKAI